jgi:hypothetical protein
VSAEVIDRATELRARHGFKSPDAIHLATALESGANEFWTGDAALSRCTDVVVTVLVPALRAGVAAANGRWLPRMCRGFAIEVRCFAVCA